MGLGSLSLWLLFTLVFLTAQAINLWKIVDYFWGLSLAMVVVLGWGIYWAPFLPLLVFPGSLCLLEGWSQEVWASASWCCGLDLLDWGTSPPVLKRL